MPLSKGGRGTTTVLLHKICHDKIHSAFTEMELKRHYNTIEKLRDSQFFALGSEKRAPILRPVGEAKR